jgi:hypothetical protein
VDIDWPTEFGRWLDRLEAEANSGGFPPKAGTVVVALFAADKAKLGDVFYDGVAARADPMIEQWKRETSYEE